MNETDHKERHKKLHEALDELVADFIRHTGRSLSESTVMDLLMWSHEQCENPTKDSWDS